MRKISETKTIMGIRFTRTGRELTERHIEYSTTFDNRFTMLQFIDKINDSKHVIIKGDPYRHKGVNLRANATGQVDMWVRSPRAWNGDRNWYEYSDNTKLEVTVDVQYK